MLTAIENVETVRTPMNVPDRLKKKWHTPCFDNLNKLDWVDGFGIQSHGVRVGIRVNDPDLIPILRERLPIFMKPYDGPEYDTILSVIRGGKEPGSRVRKFHMVYQDHTPVGRSHRLEEALERLDSWLALMIAFLAPRRVFVHAGVVGVNGRAIIIPGKSHSGKSTLVSELVRAGASYYSDEFAVLDNRGRVFPFHKPISMRSAPGSKQIDVPVEEFGGKLGHRSLVPGLVVLTEYKKDARWRPKEVSSGAAIFGLLDNCVNAQYAPKRALNALAALVDQAKTVKSKRGNAKITSSRILDTFS